MTAINFELLRAQARELDKGIEFLRKKCYEPSALGFGPRAQQTLSLLRKDILDMQAACDDKFLVYLRNNSALEESNNKAEELLYDIYNKLGRLEEKMKIKYRYVPFKEYIGSSPELNYYEEKQLLLNETLQDKSFMSSTINSMMFWTSRVLNETAAVGRRAAFVASTPGRQNQRSVEAVTPTEPEPSDITWQILGRSVKNPRNRRY